MERDQAQVTYDVKHLLDKIDRKLDDAVARMERKADVAELDVLDVRLDALERWRWRITGMASVAMLVAGAAFEIAISHGW